MNTSTVTASRPAGRTRPTSWYAALATCVVPVATATGLVAVMLDAASPSEGVADLGYSALFYAWNLSPIIGAAILLLWAGRRGWWPYAAATLANVALGVLIASALYDFTTSASSTAALIFLVLPLAGWTVVAVGVGLVALACWYARRRA